MLKINHKYDIHQIEFAENIIHYSINQIKIEWCFQLNVG